MRDGEGGIKNKETERAEEACCNSNKRKLPFLFQGF